MPLQGLPMRRDDSYRGFEVWFNDLKMSLKMYGVLGLILAVVQLVSFAVIARLWLGEIDVQIFWHWISAKAMTMMKPSYEMTFPYDGELYRMTASQLAAYLQPYMTGYVAKLIVVFIGTCSIYLTMPLFVDRFRDHAKKISGPEHLRGARLVPRNQFKAELKRELKRTKDKADIPLGDFCLPMGAEVKHAFIVGRPGVGKTVALSQVIERLQERGERGVIYDFKGDYTSRFYRPGVDLLFNPLDKRCVGWNLFNDIATQMDVDALASSLIPRAYQADPYWNDAARAVFTGLLHHLHQTNQRNNKSIWEAVSSDIKEISNWLKKTSHGEAGYTFIQDGGSKQALSVHSVVMQYARPFEFLAGIGGDFSVVDWLRNGKGWIFVTNYSDIQDTLRPILSLFIDLLGRKLLAMEDDPRRRIFFILDEFGTLQRLPTIVNLLTLSRSKGGSVWVGIQDLGQIEKIYTKDIRQAIVNACGNSLSFAVADPDTAKFLSEKAGETELLEMDQTYSMGPSEFRDGVSLAQRKKKELLILPSQLMSLPELTAYLKIGGLPMTKTVFKFKAYETMQTAFVLREDFLLGSSTSRASNVDGEGKAKRAGEDEGQSAAIALKPLDYDGREGALQEKKEEEMQQSDKAEKSTESLAEEKDSAGTVECRNSNEENLHDGAPVVEKELDEDGSREIEDEELLINSR